MKPFFLDGEGSEEYQCVREGRNYVCASVRDAIEEMWPQCSRFLDPDVQQDARTNFHQRWWEVYLTHMLLHAGVELVKRENRQPKRSGPDLLARVAGEKLWIEAVAASPGEGPDAVRSVGPPRAPRSLQDKEIMLRLQQSFSTKRLYHEKCVKNQWIAEGESYVIALNGALVERAYPCVHRFPRVVGALLAGLEEAWVEVELDGVTSRFGETQYRYKLEMEKRKSDKTVPMATFLDTANSCVSAVLYSTTDAYMQRDSVLVLNPRARAPLPTTFLPNFPRYWLSLCNNIISSAPHVVESSS